MSRFEGVVFRAHHPGWAWAPASGKGAKLHGGFALQLSSSNGRALEPGRIFDHALEKARQAAFLASRRATDATVVTTA